MSEPPTEIIVEAEAEGMRLDAFLAKRLTQFSRVRLRDSIQAGHVTVDGQQPKVAYRLLAGQKIVLTLPDARREGPEPEQIDLDVLFEDESIVVINKPPGMVVHPAKGHWSGTLTAGLAYHFEHLSSVGGATRPGIVHRLDRDTSGVIVIAKTDQAHLKLAEQFAERTTEKEYFALVVGNPDRDRDWIDRPIGAHPHEREKMAIRAGHSTSREATTFYEVAERFQGFAAIRAFPKTGRTHQIRLHLAHVGLPILCDKLYGGRNMITSRELAGKAGSEAPLLERMALHAYRLKIKHPASGAEMEFTAPVREDIEGVLKILREFRSL